MILLTEGAKKALWILKRHSYYLVGNSTPRASRIASC